MAENASLKKKKIRQKPQEAFVNRTKEELEKVLKESIPSNTISLLI